MHVEQYCVLRSSTCGMHKSCVDLYVRNTIHYLTVLPSTSRMVFGTDACRPIHTIRLDAFHLHVLLSLQFFSSTPILRQRRNKTQDAREKSGLKKGKCLANVYKLSVIWNYRSLGDSSYSWFASSWRLTITCLCQSLLFVRVYQLWHHRPPHNHLSLSEFTLCQSLPTLTS